MISPALIRSSPPSSPLVEEDQGEGYSSPAFTCLRCGNCCRHPGEVRLAEGEAEAIADALAMDVIAFTSRYTRLRQDRLGLSLLDHPDGSCIFLAAEDRAKADLSSCHCIPRNPEPQSRSSSPPPFANLASSRETSLPIHHSQPKADPPLAEPFTLHAFTCRIHSAKPRQCREFPVTWKYNNLAAICPADS